jgi:6-phosphofructokinase
VRGQLSTPVRSIGVLTGGGDVPGLNAAIKALVYHAEPEHIRVTGLRSGWEGITFLDRSRRKEELVFHSENP